MPINTTRIETSEPSLIDIIEELQKSMKKIDELFLTYFAPHCHKMNDKTELHRLYMLKLTGRSEYNRKNIFRSYTESCLTTAQGIIEDKTDLS